MYQIIAPTLFQNKICRLPGIGTLSVQTGSAKTDFVNGLMQAPEETIAFHSEPVSEHDFNEFTAVAELLKRKIDEEGTVFLEGIGSFEKKDGEISFKGLPVNPAFKQPVTAYRIIRENAEHAILVGEKETTNTEMVEYYTEKPARKTSWKLWALILALVGLAALAIYIFLFGTHSLGNIIHTN